MSDRPAAFAEAAAWLREHGAAAAAPWTSGSQQFWWDLLLRQRPVPFEGAVFDDEERSGGLALISSRRVNLSQSPREEAEIAGLVPWEAWRDDVSAGAGVRLTGVANAKVACRLGRVLDAEAGPRACPPTAPAPGRVAVRLCGVSGLVLSVRREHLQAAEVRAAPCAVPALRPLPPGLPKDCRRLPVQRMATYDRVVASWPEAFLLVPEPADEPRWLRCVRCVRERDLVAPPGARLTLVTLSLGGGPDGEEAAELLRQCDRSELITLPLPHETSIGADEAAMNDDARSHSLVPLLLAAGVVRETGRRTAVDGTHGSLSIFKVMLKQPPPSAVLVQGGGAGAFATEMQNMLSSMPYANLTIQKRNCPYFACACERIGPPGAPQDAELDGSLVGADRWEMSLGHELLAGGGSGDAGAFRDHWVSAAAASAAKKATDALMQAPSAAAKTADAALRLCADCGDAWTARGLRTAASLEDALVCFRRGVDAATAALAPSLREELEQGRGKNCAARERAGMRWPFLVHPVRPLVRAMIGEASTLRKLARWAEAADAYERLHAVDPFSHVDSSAWINWKASFPETLVAAGRLERAAAYLRDPDNEPCLMFHSSRLQWAAAAMLLDYCVHWAPGRPRAAQAAADARPWPGAGFEAVLSSPSSANFDVSELAAFPGGVPTFFVHRFPVQSSFLLGPDAGGPAPPAGAVAAQIAGSSDRPTVGALWAHVARQAWAAVPGDALAWLRRFYWTARVHGSFSNAVIYLREAPQEGALPPEPPAPPSLSEADAVARVDAGDVFVNCRLMNHQDLVILAAAGPRPSVALLRALLRRGARSWHPDDSGLRPSAFHIWCYYLNEGTGAIFTALLSATPPPPTPLLIAAAEMAAEQCNDAQLSTLLAELNARHDGSVSQDVRIGFCERFATSSVVHCLDSRGRNACHRCLRHDAPHAATADPKRTLAVLQAYSCCIAHVMVDSCRDLPLIARLATVLAEQQRANEGDARACALCFAKPAKLCQRCKAVRFCSQEYMRAMWPLHRQRCTNAAASAKSR